MSVTSGEMRLEWRFSLNATTFWMERARHSSHVGKDNQKALADTLDKNVFVVLFIVPSFDMPERERSSSYLEIDLPKVIIMSCAIIDRSVIRVFFCDLKRSTINVQSVVNIMVPFGLPYERWACWWGYHCRWCRRCVLLPLLAKCLLAFGGLLISMNSS